MKKNAIVWLIISICFLFPVSLLARSVSDQEAEKTARKWVTLENSSKHLRRTPADLSPAALTPWIHEGRKIGYVVSLVPEGFILIPPITELPPVQYISYQGDFNLVSAHPFFQILGKRLTESLNLLGYDSELKAAPLGSTELDPAQVSTSRNQAAWESLLSDILLSSDLTAGERVPLLTSTWNQDAPFNNFTPLDNAAHCPVGCTATALAQVMYYWKHPARGLGSHSYTWWGGPLTADFEHDYYWSNMVVHYSGTETGPQQEAVARLMSDVGIAVDMNYCGPQGSAAHPYTNNALTAFFDYSDLLTKISRSKYDSWQAWFDMFKEQLDQRWPVVLVAYNFSNDPALGHTLVVDGYRTDNLINLVHVNLGWGGLSDGYYALEYVYRSTPPVDDSDYALINIFPDTYQPPTMVSGRVTAYDASPVICAEPQFWKEGASGIFAKLKSVQTDTSGLYRIPLTPGRYKIFFNAQIANWNYTQCDNGGRVFNNEWYENRGSLNPDMYLDDAKIITVNAGDRLTIDAVLEKGCWEFPNCPTWFQPWDLGNQVYLFMWGSGGWGCSWTDAYQLQRATQSDFSDAVVVYRGFPPPFYQEGGLAPGTYHYRIRGENYCTAGLWVEYLNHQVVISFRMLYLPLILN